jgi:hypothetical protein
MKAAIRVVLSIFLLASTGAQAAVNAWLDKNRIAPGDTVQLTLQHEGQASGQPDVAPLKRDFDILSSSRSSSMRIVNGQTTSSTQLVFALAPKRNGQLTIPSLNWDGEASQALVLTIANSAAGANQNGNGTQSEPGNIFLETEVDQRHPYVQAAVTVTVKLYFAEAIYKAGLDLEVAGDALVRQVGSDQQGNVVRNGKPYNVITRHYIVFPQHSGKVSLPGAVFNAQIVARQKANVQSDDPLSDFFDQSSLGGLVTSTKPIRLHGDAIELDVQPRPAGASASYWLPASGVSLTSEWHPSALQAHVGEPITLDLKLQATGLTAEQLPDLAAMLNAPADLKLYPDKAKLDNATQGDAVIGTRTQSIALIADRAGDFTLPALHVQWLDTKTNLLRDIDLPARSLTILPAIGAAGVNSLSSSDQSPAAQAQTQNSSSASTLSHRDGEPTVASNSTGVFGDLRQWQWQWLSLALGLAWLATVVAWLVSRRTRLPSESIVNKELPTVVRAAAARKLFHAACSSNDAPSARRHLLEWAKATWTDDPPIGLQALATRIDNAAHETLLRDLDRACYVGGAWQGAQLLNALSDLSVGKQPQKQTKPKLAALYP